MRTVRIALRGLTPGPRTLTPAEARYLIRVHRLRADDRFAAFDPEAGTEADAQVVSERGEVLVDALRPAPVLVRPRTHWIHALAKGDKCDAIVRDVSELGAHRVTFVGTERSVVRLTDARIEGRLSRFRAIAEDAARQCGRPDVAEVALTSFEHVLEMALETEPHIVFSPGGQPLAQVLLGIRAEEPITFFAGPEGGFSPAEITALEAAHFVASRWGLILRTETVPAAVLGAASVWRGQQV